jgi:hypothetical protein
MTHTMNIAGWLSQRAYQAAINPDLPAADAKHASDLAVDAYPSGAHVANREAI